MLPMAYREFIDDISSKISSDRIYTDPLRTLAYGTDASFYRLIPRVVIKSSDESEVVRILSAAHARNLPVTFRAAGTSLSGQAISDSILIVATHPWESWEILDNGERIRLQPGVIGANANQYLAPYGKKIGPDPASINSAMIGGIAANNASGMCCGTVENSYQTIDSMRLIFDDGTLLDTADPASREAFAARRQDIMQGLERLMADVRANGELSERIRHKFKMKNTTGFSLNALIDFEDPFDVLLHLMIGSEGTLAFISEITYRTVVEHAHKASALMIFPDTETACNAVICLRQQPVSAVELMDRAGLRSVEDKEGMPPWLKELSDGATALLTEVRAESCDALHAKIDQVLESLRPFAVERPIEFTEDPAVYTVYWNIRKGLFPAVGAIRTIGTTVIIEDVAFPIDQLAKATLELQDLFARYGYDEAIIFGHALEGNLHFVFTQDFGTQAEIDRYAAFMDEVCQMTAVKYQGALKAEHGTGRNMAPYVELEWGKDAYEMMCAIKQLFDPNEILNPGVIINKDQQAHIKHLKPMPQTNELVDKCIECGFCEPQCPSKNLTLTPRQRIVSQREISRLKITREDEDRLRAFERDFAYQGEATCAADGLCAMACPVGINTGDLTKDLRYRMVLKDDKAQRRADWAANNFASLTRNARRGFKVLNLGRSILGDNLIGGLAQGVRKLSGDRIPAWTNSMPRGVDGPAPKRALSGDSDGDRPRVVYFPSCIAQTMGPAQSDTTHESIHAVMERLLRKAGYEVIYPANMGALCCGTPWESKGFMEQADRKSAELEAALKLASRQGEYPILCDTSPCLYRMRRSMDSALKLYEPFEFIHDFLLERLDVEQLDESVALHVTCSSRKMGLDAKFRAVAEACSSQIVIPSGVNCCGFAGDRGFNYPELNASALEPLREQVAHCSAGYSNSRTCEIGLSDHGGIHYRSIAYLVDRASRPRPTRAD